MNVLGRLGVVASAASDVAEGAGRFGTAAAGVAVAAATCAGGVELGDAVEPEMTAGAAKPPAVARLATRPSTTDPFAGTLVAEATTAWPRGVAETWEMSWIPVSTGVPAIAEAAEVPAEAAPEASACEPDAHAESPATASTRRSAARTGAVRRSGRDIHAPFNAFVETSARCSFARARRTRARAFTSVMPSMPATSS